MYKKLLVLSILLAGVCFNVKAKRYDFDPSITEIWKGSDINNVSFEQYARSELAFKFKFDENEASARANEVFNKIVELFLSNKCLELHKLLCTIAVDDTYEDVREYFVLNNGRVKLYDPEYRYCKSQVKLPEIVNKNHSKNTQRKMIYLFNDFWGILLMCEPDDIIPLKERFYSLIYSLILGEEFAPVFLGLPIIALKAFNGDAHSNSILKKAKSLKDRDLDYDIRAKMAIEFYQKNKEYFHQCIEEYFAALPFLVK